MRVQVTYDPNLLPSAESMKIGDIALIEDNECMCNHYLLRHYSGWVDLNDPERTWANGARTPKIKRILSKGTKLELEITTVK